ncbi:hypothetical protein [Clostridium sulfidigenes]|uniref:hypothetical protein n=1 Tax=Clostridium sulfidigenes TaxID=318464 RepID=UPI003F887B91
MGEELLYENYTLLLNSVMLRKLDNNKKAIMNFKNSIITQVNDILTVAPFQSRKNIFSTFNFQNNYNTLLNFHLKEKKVDLNLIGSKLLITDFINILYDKFNFPYYHIIRDKLIITNNPSPSLVRINKLNHNFNNVELERYISNLLLAQLQNKDDIAHKIQHIYINSVDKKIFNLVNITGYFSKFEERIPSVNFVFVNKDSYEENNTYIEKLKENNYIFASGTEDFISSISKKDRLIRLRDINFIHIESLITTIYIDKNYESFQNEKYNLEKAIVNVVDVLKEEKKRTRNRLEQHKNELKELYDTTEEYKEKAKNEISNNILNYRQKVKKEFNFFYKSSSNGISGSVLIKQVFKSAKLQEKLNELKYCQVHQLNNKLNKNSNECSKYNELINYKEVANNYPLEMLEALEELNKKSVNWYMIFILGLIVGFAIPPGLLLFLPAVWIYINFIIGSNKTLRQEYESNIEEFISKAAYATLDINSHIISNIYEQALRRVEGKYNSTYGNPKDQERFIKKVNLIENVDLSYKSINSIMSIVSGDDKFGL